jgi:Leucine-rich repeat (LRR) protein
MSISSTGLYGNATLVATDLFDDVQALKEEMVTLSTSYLTTTNEHRIDISQNRLDISQNLSKINDLSNNRIKDIEDNITDLSNNRIKDIEDNITDLSNNRIKDIEDSGVSVVYCKRKWNILWNVRVFRGITKALKQQPRTI